MKLPAIASLALVAACASSPPPAPPTSPALPVLPPPVASPAPSAGNTHLGSALSADEARAAALITPAAILAPTRYLSDDLLEGRGTGARGDELAAKYIASELESLGLVPGADDAGGKSWFQKVPMIGITAKLPPSVAVQTRKGALALSIPTDLVVVSGVQEPKVAVPPTDVVFVGYGIVAPEYQWDDYKDVDVKGKVVIVMNNDPETDPNLFAGPTRLWYGRWDYKYLQAAKKGAAGVLIIHTDHSAGYPWHVVESSFGKEKAELPATPGEPRVPAKMWITDAAAKKLVSAAGEDLDALRKGAESRDFRPKTLAGVRFGVSFTNTLRKMEGANVLGLLPGADPAHAGEVVVFSAHHDHLGIGSGKGDVIYNGAVDNASGSGALVAIARAAASAPRPRRSILFLAVTAEEQGLLGSEWYARHPTFPPSKIAADLNMDSMNVSGRTSDLGYVGFGKSSLDRVVVDVARAQGREVHGDAFPDRGGFYRSDQFSFAKIGVPSIYVRGGPSFVGRPPGYGKEVMEDYEKHRYHQPSDEVDPKWDLAGAVEDAQLLFVAGERIANDDAMPTWKEGDEFARIKR